MARLRGAGAEDGIEAGVGEVAGGVVGDGEVDVLPSRGGPAGQMLRCGTTPMAYLWVSWMNLTFIESPIYSDQIDDLLSEDEHHLLQLALLEQPEEGDLIRGSGGLRKLRWSVAGSGKRGGIRVIYYLYHRETAYMLFAYRKNRQEDLNADQVKLLKQLIEHYTHER
jgi:mRNA-degrading endonuclease RelE of RelBE toxin-antitoxin system